MGKFPHGQEQSGEISPCDCTEKKRYTQCARIDCAAPGGRMATYFMNPANRYIEKATGPWTWLWALLFGPFYFIYKGAWPHAFAYVFALLFLGRDVIAVLVATLLWIVFAFAAYPIVRKTYLRKGWVETSGAS